MDFSSKKERGIWQLEEMKKHLEAANECIDIDCITQCLKHPIAGEVDWMMWNMYLSIYVPGQYKQPMELIEQIKMMVYLSLVNVASLAACHKIEDAYKQLDKQHATLREIALGIQDLVNALEQINVHPMHRSKRAERNRARLQKEKNDLKRKGML